MTQEKSNLQPVHDSYKINRNGWPQGPWDAEPEDKLNFIYKNLDCMIVRNSLGSWCGYVGVNNTHPLYGLNYSSIEQDLNVHGGLTYSDKCTGSVCHTPEPGRTDDIWWLGFDCAHSGDLVPKFSLFRHQLGESRFYDEAYRTKEYVIAEVKKLADQIGEII